MSEPGKGDEAAWSCDKQKMIKKLTEMGIYEIAMAEKEMKDILVAINQSQDEANPGARNKNVNMAPEVTRHENQACYSRGHNTKASNRDSSSPELSANQMRRNSSQGKRAGSGDETIFSPHGKSCFVKENKDLPPANINKARFAINENSSEAVDNKQSVQRTNSQMRNQETPKHRINPLDAILIAGDVPLQPHYRTLPDKDCAEVGNSVNIDTALPQLSSHLQRVAESWHSQHGSFVRAQAAWGKAIQVGTDNGSLDDESVPDATSEDAGPSETNVNCDTHRRRRACARKVIDYAAGELIESDSDDEIQQSSKTKKPTKGADSSDKTYQPKRTVGNVATRRRKISPNRDDIYVWDDTNEEDLSDTEMPKNAKKMKLTKRADSPEYAEVPPKETVSTESTKSSSNIAEQGDTSECETVHGDKDNDEASQKGAKRKKPATKSVAETKRAATGRTRRQKSIEPFLRDASVKQDDKPVCVDDSDEIMISDNEDSDQSLWKSSGNRSDDAVSSTSSMYPRRIIPPNPKGKFAGIRARKPLSGLFNQSRGKKQVEQGREKDDEEVAHTNSKSRSRSALQDYEISAVSNSVDEAEEVIPPVDVEIRPLQISVRMKMQVERLKALREEQEELEAKRANEQRAREEQVRREKDEKIRERLKEQKLKVQREEQEAKAKVIVEERWNAMLNQKGKRRHSERTELNPEGPRQNSDLPIVEETNDVEVLNAGGRSGEQPPKLVPCPICGKKYPAKRIEDHAANCEEFEATSSAGASRSNSPATSTRFTTYGQRGASSKLWECSVCSAFSTSDGKKYEDHVNKCIARHRDSGTDSNSFRKTVSDVVVVPDSPIRSLRRVSEQTDSEINYTKQFVPKTKSNINNNRKRKRL